MQTLRKRRKRQCKIGLLLFTLLCFISIGTALAEPLGKKEYLARCVRCHGVDGKDRVPAMRTVPGYRAVDLTQLTKKHGGRFPRKEVYDAIVGRRRLPAHFVGDMPEWGLEYRLENQTLGTEQEKLIKAKIEALVDYVESLQEP